MSKQTTHWSLDYIGDLLENYTPPTGPFDPAGAWEQRYMVALVVPEEGRNKSSDQGHMLIRRTPMIDDDLIRLDVELTVLMAGASAHRTCGCVTCKNDLLCSPVSWCVQSDQLTSQGALIPRTHLIEEGFIEAGRWVRVWKKGKRSMEAPVPLTSDWSLFEAVQRFPGRRTRPLDFSMLEEMDQLRPEQHLEETGVIAPVFDGKSHKLRGYHQTGRGILPYHYWVDEANRLLFAVGGIQGFVLVDSKML